MKKLLDLSSAPLRGGDVVLSKRLRSLAGSLVEDLFTLLDRRNGFYAFEGALHVLPSAATNSEIGLEDWNAEDLWRTAYKGMATQGLFFAEDAFGGQFCITNEGVCTFDPETGAYEFFSSDLKGWSKKMLDDYEVVTGYPLAHEWQTLNGQLQIGQRLVPTIPFTLGGPFSVENLKAIDAVKAMRYRGSIALQIRDLPDGATVKLDVID